ncbi:hypothetical protein Tco_1165494 [Tanacetum coccineum]
MKVEESLNVTFDESHPPTKLSPLADDDVGEEEAVKNYTKVVYNNNKDDESIEVDKVVNIKESKNHPLDQDFSELDMFLKGGEPLILSYYNGPDSDDLVASYLLRKMSSLKAKQPKKPPPKKTRNVGKSKRTQLTTSSSTESPPSDNKDLPSTKLSPRSYHGALKDDPNMSKEQRETRGVFKNLGRALQNFARILKKGCR